MVSGLTQPGKSSGELVHEGVLISFQLVSSDLNVSLLSLSLASCFGDHLLSMESFAAVLNARLSPEPQVLSVSIQPSESSMKAEEDGKKSDDDDDGSGSESGGGVGVSRTSVVSMGTSTPETDEIVRRMALAAVWDVAVDVDPEADLRVQRFDEKVKLGFLLVASKRRLAVSSLKRLSLHALAVK